MSDDDQAPGGFLANLLGADGTAEGPPYTHTIRPPEPAGGHITPHFDAAGLCWCPCEDCTARLLKTCWCADCPCDFGDAGEHPVPETAGGDLRWHYGPAETGPDRGRMWCRDCKAEVWCFGGDYICSGCKRVSEG